MLIGELSNRSGLSRDTIRYYEKFGLINLKRNDRRENNYKEYKDETLQQLLTIKLIKGFGFTLNEVSELLSLMDINEAKCDNVLELFDDKVQKIDEKIRELIQIRSLLLDGRNKCKSSCCDPLSTNDNCQLLIPEV